MPRCRAQSDLAPAELADLVIRRRAKDHRSAQLVPDLDLSSLVAAGLGMNLRPAQQLDRVDWFAAADVLAFMSSALARSLSDPTLRKVLDGAIGDAGNPLLPSASPRRA